MPSGAALDDLAGNFAGYCGGKTLIRCRNMFPAAGQRGRSPEHARARVVSACYAGATVGIEDKEEEFNHRDPESTEPGR